MLVCFFSGQSTEKIWIPRDECGCHEGALRGADDAAQLCLRCSVRLTILGRALDPKAANRKSFPIRSSCRYVHASNREQAAAYGSAMIEDAWNAILNIAMLESSKYALFSSTLTKPCLLIETTPGTETDSYIHHSLHIIKPTLLQEFSWLRTPNSPTAPLLDPFLRDAARTCHKCCYVMMPRANYSAEIRPATTRHNE